MTDFIPCTLKRLKGAEEIAAADQAIAVNPVNGAAIERLAVLMPEFVARPEHAAVVTQRYWGPRGVKLGVAFLDNAPLDLQKRILGHMNAWGQWANVEFHLTTTDPQVRITRSEEGYWSYLGTDILGIPRGLPTMCLHGFTMQTPESEYKRVVRHETGHTLGMPHEHMRLAIVQRLDEARTIAYFMQTQGWSATEVRQQVLTPLDERSLLQEPGMVTDVDSIMCYQLPGAITKDGRPIPGGYDIDASDAAYISKVYPKDVLPPSPPGPSPCWAVLQGLKVYNFARHNFFREGGPPMMALTTNDIQQFEKVRVALGGVCASLLPLLAGLPWATICQTAAQVCPASGGGTLDWTKVIDLLRPLLCPQQQPGFAAPAAEATAAG